MTETLPDTLTLVADIGGTNTRVALARGADVLPDTVRRFRNAQYPGLAPVLHEFIEAAGGVDCTGACVAIAGPVRDGRGKLTNLDWEVDPDLLMRATRAEDVDVLNDLQAQGHALGFLPAGHLREVVPGSGDPADGTQLVIGVGTGFNASPVHHLPDRRLVAPAEAGHGNLPVRTEDEMRLCRFVEAAHGFAAVEDVLSGRGLERVHAWLGQEAGDHSTATAAEIVAAAGEKGRAQEAVGVFVRMMGRVAGNLALDHLPFGGVFLAGGVARAVAPYMADAGFADAFRDKGRFSGFMGNFGIFVIEDDFAALTGSAAHMARVAARRGN